MRLRICKFLCALMMMLCCSFSVALAESHDDKSLIKVAGQAKLDVVPDEVHIAMMIQKDNVNLEEAQKQNDEVASRILRILKTRLAIDEKYIQTNYINVRPVYEYPQCGNRRCTTPQFVRFETKKGITVRLKEIDKLQELLQKSIEAGVTNINNVQFASSKFDKLQDEAQILAVKDAKRRAGDIATALGVGLGDPHKITINNSHSYGSRPKSMMAMESISIASVTEETIALGQITITANVHAEFAID